MEHNLRENTSKAAYLNQIQRLEVTSGSRRFDSIEPLSALPQAKFTASTFRLRLQRLLTGPARDAPMQFKPVLKIVNQLIQIR